MDEQMYAPSQEPYDNVTEGVTDAVTCLICEERGESSRVLIAHAEDHAKSHEGEVA